MTRDNGKSGFVQVSAQKAGLRRAMAKLLKGMSAEEREAGSKRLRGHLGEEYASQVGQEGLVLGYAADATEPDILELGAGFGGNWRFCLPRVQGEGRLGLYEVSGPEDLEVGAFGLREPIMGKAIERDLGQVGLILVPGRAFSLDGARLGRGGGFYDRLLSQDGRPFAVGCCFEGQVVESVPEEPHDVRVDVIVAG